MRSLLSASAVVRRLRSCDAARREAHSSAATQQAAAAVAAPSSSATAASAALAAAALRVRAMQPWTNAYITPFDAETMQRVSAPATNDPVAAAAAAASPPPPPAASRQSPPLLVSLKDNFALASVRTTAASRMLSSFVPHYDSTVAARLKRAGAVLTGKTNMDEFGMGSFSTRSHFGRVINPWSFRGCRTVEEAEAVLKDESRLLSAGGSSGGSAAALAAGTCDASIGSDTGGSIRLPAAYCGVLGLKPTYGRVSRFGLVAYASSMDSPAIMARDTRTLRTVLGMIEGVDPRDSTSMDLPPTPAFSPFDDLRSVFAPSARPSARRMLEGLTIGLPCEYDLAELSPAVRAAWHRCARLLQEEGGARVVHVSLPHTRHALPAYYILAPAEAQSNLARYDGVRFGHSESKTEADRIAAELAEAAAAASSALDPGPPAQSLQSYYTSNRSGGFGPEVQRRVLVGSFVLSSRAVEGFHQKAQRIRRAVCADFEAAFHPTAASGHTKIDLLLTPTAVGPALSFAQIGAQSSVDPVSAYLNDVFTIPANLAGLPAISVPVSSGHEAQAEGATVTAASAASAVPPQSLPVGLQLIGDFHSEAALIDVAAWITQRISADTRAGSRAADSELSAEVGGLGPLAGPLSADLRAQMERRQRDREQSGQAEEERAQASRQRL